MNVTRSRVCLSSVSATLTCGDIAGTGCASKPAPRKQLKARGMCQSQVTTPTRNTPRGSRSFAAKCAFCRVERDQTSRSRARSGMPSPTRNAHSASASRTPAQAFPPQAKMCSLSPARKPCAARRARRAAVGDSVAGPVTRQPSRTSDISSTAANHSPIGRPRVTCAAPSGPACLPHGADARRTCLEAARDAGSGHRICGVPPSWRGFEVQAASRCPRGCRKLGPTGVVRGRGGRSAVVRVRAPATSSERRPSAAALRRGAGDRGGSPASLAS